MGKHIPEYGKSCNMYATAVPVLRDPKKNQATQKLQKGCPKYGSQVGYFRGFSPSVVKLFISVELIFCCFCILSCFKDVMFLLMSHCETNTYT